VKSKKPIRPAPRVRRRSPVVVVERAFTVVLEGLHARFDVFGEALQLRTDIALLKTAVLDVSKRSPSSSSVAVFSRVRRARAR
jgi:hypothetical protein